MKKSLFFVIISVVSLIFVISMVLLSKQDKGPTETEIAKAYQASVDKENQELKERLEEKIKARMAAKTKQAGIDQPRKIDTRYLKNFFTKVDSVKKESCQKADGGLYLCSLTVVTSKPFKTNVEQQVSVFLEHADGNWNLMRTLAE